MQSMRWRHVFARGRYATLTANSIMKPCIMAGACPPAPHMRIFPARLRSKGFPEPEEATAPARRRHRHARLLTGADRGGMRFAAPRRLAPHDPVASRDAAPATASAGKFGQDNA